MGLELFPRPKNDNGIGMHFGLDARQKDLDLHLPMLEAMRVKWVVFYTTSPDQARNCVQAAAERGMQAVIRPKARIDEPFDFGAYARALPGQYIQIYNESGNPREWRGQVPEDYISVWAPRWREAARQVAEAGAFPGLQVMGSEEAFPALNGLAPNVAHRVWMASHAYPSNHPPGYWVPNDDVTQLKFLMDAQWADNALGFVPPVIVTEGGYQYGQLEDNRYARIDDTLHAAWNVAIFEQFHNGVLANGEPLPDYLFAICPWLWSHPDWTSWYHGIDGTREETINAVKAIPAFVRSGVVINDPPPSPPPVVVPPPSELVRLPGIHFPNGGFRDLDKLWGIQWDAFTLLHYERSYVREIRQRYPKARILIRHHLDNWTQADPVKVAQEIANYANELREFGIEITPANEQNLKSEGHPQGAGNGNGPYPPPKYYDGKGNVVETTDPKDPRVVRVSCQLYEDINTWNLAVVRELRRLIPWCKLHFPAISQGHSDDQNDAGYVGYEILRPAIEAFDVLDIHTYWNGPVNRESEWFGRRYLKAMAFFLGKEVFISECGSDVSWRNDNGTDLSFWMAQVPQNIPFTPFIWDSDARNDSWRIHNKQGLVNALRYPLVRPPAPPPAPIPVPLPTPVVLQAPFPGYCVTQAFGADPDYYKPFGFKGHEGVDLVPRGADWTVHAVEDGVVVRDRDVPDKSYGNYVVVWNSKTRRGWWYCHLAKNVVQIGQAVKAGQALGTMGATGNTRGAHLHLALRMTNTEGYAVDLDNGMKGFVEPPMGRLQW